MTKGRMRVMRLAGKAGKLVSKVKRMGAKGIAMVAAGVMLLSACPLPVQAFAYHDNDVRFYNWTGRYDIRGGSFEIEDLGISEGQDPDHLNYVSKVVPLVEEREYETHFRFRVGRHSTESIAERWNCRFTSDNTIRGVSSKLSFWFLGKVNLTILDKNTNRYYYTGFENIGFAQTHESGKDPWHFGQAGGERRNLEYLDTYGTARDDNGNNYTVKITYQMIIDSSYEFIIDSITFYPR